MVGARPLSNEFLRDNAKHIQKRGMSLGKILILTAIPDYWQRFLRGRKSSGRQVFQLAKLPIC